MSYDEYAAFLAHEIDFIAEDSSLEALISELLPTTAAKRLSLDLQNKLDLRCRETFNTQNQDIVLSKVKDTESAALLEELKIIIDVIGDFPRDRVGSDITNANGNESRRFFSLQNIMEDLEKLPKVALVDGEDENDLSLMLEYNSLRETLAEKVQVIRTGETRLRIWQAQLSKLDALFEAIRETHNGDVSAYFQDYRARVLEEAQETAYLLEEVLKKNTGISPEKASRLVELAEQLELT